MGLIVSITLVLGLIFYWEGRRLYKEPEEHSKLQRIAITIKLGGISYLKSLFMLACLIAPAVIMYLIGDAIKDLYDFSKDFKENPSLTGNFIDSINHLLLSIGAGLAIGIAVTAFCLGLLIIYRTRKLEKDE
ncbi:MAG: hypothetical protein V8Q45_00035 [Alistipes onderdonkii]